MHSKTEKRWFNLLLVFALSVVLLIGASCTNSQSSQSQQPEQPIYVLNEPVLELNVGDMFSLSVLGLKGGEIVEWRSMQANIASIDSQGLVTAKAPGETKVIVTVNQQTLSCIINVSVKLNFLPVFELQGMQKQDGEYKVALMLGDEYTLNPVLELDGETLEVQFTLTSNDSAVSIDGNTLCALAETQEAQILVSCQYESKTYSLVCYVTVEEVLS